MTILLIVLSAALIAAVVQEVRELRFYHRNGWDFSKDNDITLFADLFYTNRHTKEPLSNWQRVAYGRPIFLFVLPILIGGLSSIVMYPENWRYDGHTYHYIGWQQ